MVARFSIYAGLVFTGLIFAAFRFGAAVHFAPAEGWLAYTTTSKAQAAEFNIEIAALDAGGRVHPIRAFGPFAVADDLAWSPDGDQFVFSDHRDIYLADVPRELVVRLTQASDTPVSARTPVWSPQGDRVAYLFYTQDQTSLRVFDFNSLSTRLIDAPMVTPVITWAPAGDALLLVMQVITNNSGFTTDIMRLSLDTGQLVDLTPNYANDTEPVFSPNGQNIAFMSNRTGAYQIYTMDKDGKNVVQVTRGGSLNEFPKWLSDHQIIFYSYNGSPAGNSVATYNLDTRQSQPLTTSAALTQYALSRDASRTAVILNPGNSVFKLCAFSLDNGLEDCPAANALPYLNQLVWGR